MKVEIWSDVVCPWCYIGKRRFERALARFPHADEVEVEWRSFQLDPEREPGVHPPLAEYLAKKYGQTVEQARAMNAHITGLAAAEGLEYHLDRYVVANTFDAHRLTKLAAERGLGPQLHERFLHAQMSEGATMDDHETLVRLAAEVGIPEADSRRVLASDAYADAVNADLREVLALGGSGVPFFVIDRAYGISGAQSEETFLRALEQAHAG